MILTKPAKIMIEGVDGNTRPIAETRWQALEEAIDTVARQGARSGRGPRWAEAAVLAWCRHAGRRRPAVDDAYMHGDVMTLSEYDADADYEAAVRITA